MTRAKSLIAVALSVASVAAVATAQSPEKPDEVKVAQAQELTREPSPDQTGPSVGDARAARSRANLTIGRIPMPHGGNVNGIQWEAAGGQFGAAEIQATIEYNAACQWIRALADGREAVTAQRVLDEAPEWPALREFGGGLVIGRAAADARTRTGDFDAVLRDCRASHERQVAYARARGLEPSS